MQISYDYEQEESGRFDQMQREWENQNKDPDDVFFTARDRKQEIKKQIKNLQSGLQWEHRKRKSKRKRSR